MAWQETPLLWGWQADGVMVGASVEVTEQVGGRSWAGGEQGREGGWELCREKRRLEILDTECQRVGGDRVNMWGSMFGGTK